MGDTLRPESEAGPPDSLPVDKLFELVYGELRSLAQGALRAQRADHTLQPTALVHEVWLKLAGGLDGAKSRGHFLATAARAMRQVLQDHARAKSAVKRGERAPGVLLEGLAQVPGEFGVEFVVLEDALTRLAELNPRHAQIAELRILGGLTMPEVAEEIGVSLRTIEGDWPIARAWLRRTLAA